MSLHTSRWHMAYFLCNFQGFPLLWAASAKMLKKLPFPFFSTAAKHHFYDLIAPKPSFFRPLPRSPAEFEHDTTYKQMAHGLFSLQFSRFSFALGRAASAKLLKKLQFPSFQWVYLPFSSFSFALGRSIRETAQKVAISMLFPLQESLIFMISLR